MGIKYINNMTSRIGYDPQHGKDDLSPLDLLAAAGFSAGMTRATCQPLDVVKIRMQLQTRSKPEAQYKNLFHALLLIPKEEGFFALWKGHLPAQYLSITYGMIQFGSFELFTKILYSESNDGRFPGLHFASGFLSGICGTLCSYPFDTVRTRLVAQPGQGTRRLYRGSLNAFRTMTVQEGLASVFKGIVPTLAMAAPYSSLQFGFYGLFNSWIPFQVDQLGENISVGRSLLCGALAGLCSKLTVFPLDTVKKRLQVTGFEARREIRFNGMLDCVSKTLKREGVQGLFKGVSPALVKAVSITAINFSFYEYCVMILVQVRKANSS